MFRAYRALGLGLRGLGLIGLRGQIDWGLGWFGALGSGLSCLRFRAYVFCGSLRSSFFLWYRARGLSIYQCDIGVPYQNYGIPEKSILLRPL